MAVTTEEAIRPIKKATERVLTDAAPRLAALIGNPVRVRFDWADNAVYIPAAYITEERVPIFTFRGRTLLWRWRQICGVGGATFSGAGITAPLLISIHPSWTMSDRYGFFFRKLFEDLKAATGLDMEFREF